MNGLNTIETPTINGLRSLTLDQLDTSILSTDSIYLSNIETNDIIVDNDIILQTNASIIANGATVTDVEVSYLDGASSNLQNQLANLNTKCLNIVGTDSTTTTINNDLVLTQNMETPGILFDSSVTPQIDPFTPADKTKLDDTTLINSVNKLNANLISTGVITNTEFDYLNGVTSNIQTQIDTAVNYDSRIDALEDATQNITYNVGLTETQISGDTYIANLSTSTNIGCLGVLFNSSVTVQVDPFRPADKTKLAIASNTELGYLAGTTSDIQTQFTALKTKASLVYENSVNDFINQADVLTWDTLYNSTYEWDTTAITDSLLTSGNINKVGRYLVTFNVKVAKMRWFNEITSKIVVRNSSDNSIRYQSMVQGRKNGPGK